MFYLFFIRWKLKGSNKIEYYDRNSKLPQWKVVSENYCVDQLSLHPASIDHRTCKGEDQDILLICSKDSGHSENEDDEVCIKITQKNVLYEYTKLTVLLFLCRLIVIFLPS